MPNGMPSIQPVAESFEDRTPLRVPVAENRPREADPAASPPVGVEVRTHSAPGSLRLITDIVDAATRAVLYRIPPQAVTDADVRQSELISRYERLMSSAAPAPRRNFGV